MSPRKKQQVAPHALMTVRQVSEEHGIPLVTAESLFRVIAREDGLVRYEGFRRVFARREDVERRLYASGGMRWV